MSSSLPLRWTGEPILDAGLAACMVMRSRSSPAHITQADWVEWLNQILKDYLSGAVDKLLSVAFTKNGFNNPRWKGATREEKIKEIFALATGESSMISISEPRPPAGTKCAFYPEEDAVIYAARDRFPMLPERGNLNFTINGEGFIPLSQWALGCVLGFFYVAPLVGGRFLLPASTDDELLLEVCHILHNDFVLRWLTLARSEGLKIQHPRSRFGEVLEKAMGKSSGEDASSAPVMVFYLSNSGQDPGIDIYRYASVVQYFLQRVQAARYREAWQSFLHSFWVVEKKGKDLIVPPQAHRAFPSSLSHTKEGDPWTSRNLIHEFLPLLPEKSATFVRNFFKSYVYRRLYPSGSANPSYENTNLPLMPINPIWNVVELFVETFFPAMTSTQITRIKTLAKNLATLIEEGIEPNAWKELLGVGGVNVDRYDHWRALLIRLLRKWLVQRSELLFRLDDFLELFEKAEGYPETNWKLSRDLIQIALLEELYDRGFLNPDRIKGLEKPVPESEDEENEL